jgi:signal transduction histidine kinase
MSIYSHKNVLNCITDGFFTINSNWEITGMNPVAESSFNLIAKTAIGRRADEVFTSRLERKKFITRYKKVMDEKISVSFEESYEGQSFQINAFPELEGGVAVFYKDITSERKKETDLKHALEVKNMFLSIASHELKTPITGLKLQAEMAKRTIDRLGPEALSPEKVKKIIENFHQDINRLKRLVDDMLDISRINTGKLSMSFEYINFDEFMEEIKERLSLNFPNFNRLVKVNINTPVIIQMDPLRLEQVINNLISNAFRYGQDSDIELTTCYNDEFLFISVSDQGPGIKMMEQDLIFKKFEQSNVKRETSGLGLGLFISHEIIKEHRGSIHLRSAPGEGATFKVQLPLIRS